MPYFRLPRPTTQPAQVVGARAAAAWSGAIGVDQVSGRIITPSTSLSSKASRFGRALCVSGTGSLNRAILRPYQGADLPGAGDFTCAILFQFAQVTTGYAAIGRWNTGGSAGTNDWFLGSAGSGGLSSGELQFNVEVGSTTYSAANLFAGWNASRPYLLIGRRRGTTIDVLRYDYVAGAWRTGSTTNAGITTINSNSARSLKLGELDTSASLNADVDMYGAYLFRRAISDAEVEDLAVNFWRHFGPQRIWVPVSAGGGTTYDVSLTESVTPTDTASALATLAAAMSESASGTDTASAQAVLVAAVSESATATDTPSALLSLVATLNEAASAADAASAIATLGATVSESVSATDVCVAALAAVAAVSEVASAADSASWSGASYSADLTESASPADAVAAAAQLVAQVAEAGSAADVLQTAASLVALITAPASAADSVAAGGSTYSVSLAELAAALDVVVGVLAGGTVIRAALTESRRLRTPRAGGRPAQLSSGRRIN